MTCGGRTVLIAAGVLVLSSAPSLLAQQTPPPSRSEPPPMAQQATPPPRAESRAIAQGFSVVLVLADLQAATTQDDVPPAARRALADMKDFLPYKSYKLLDAAWILGQGSSGTVTRLRGTEEQEYELRMQTSPAGSRLSTELSQGAQRSNAGGVFVRFTLSEGSRSTPVEVTEVARTTEEEKARSTSLTLYRNEVARLERELQDAKKRREVGTASPSQVSDVERQLFEARDRLARAQARSPRPSTKVSGHFGPVIDTTFTMDVGETVVVGTSRLKGNSRALIALLTAVPAKSTVR